MNIFSTVGRCFGWNHNLLVVNLTASAVIGLAHLVIAFLLLRAVATHNPEYHEPRRKWLATAFAIFIGLCGATRIMAIIDVWIPAYLLTACFQIICASVSVTVAAMLPTALKSAPLK